MRTVLVTGGAGFIGSHLVGFLLRQGYNVVCFDNFDSFYSPGEKYLNIAGHLSNKNLYFVEGSVMSKGSLSSVFSAYTIDAVVHLAGKGGIRPPQQSHECHIDINVVGTANVLECCVKYGVNHFVYASSSAVYGDSPEIPLREDQPTDSPMCAYAASKKAGELVCFDFFSSHKIGISIIRPFTVYGTGQRWEMAIPVFTHRLHRRLPITIFGDGEAGRDYIDVRDVVRCISLILCPRSSQILYEVYNVGTGTAISVNRLVEEISERLPYRGKPRIQHVPEAEGEAKITLASTVKARQELGFKSEISIFQGLDDYVAWFLKEKKNAIS
jgi:UDP-glucuronate 4-epimerase